MGDAAPAEQVSDQMVLVRFADVKPMSACVFQASLPVVVGHIHEPRIARASSGVQECLEDATCTVTHREVDGAFRH